MYLKIGVALIKRAILAKYLVHNGLVCGNFLRKLCGDRSKFTNAIAIFWYFTETIYFESLKRNQFHGL